MTTYLALGSNLGDRLENLREARRRLQRLAQSEIASAALYETDPVDCPAGSPPFLNTVVAFETGLAPLALLRETQQIESDLGRAAREARAVNAPRPVDLDLLVCGDQVQDSAELTLPHPRLHERRFVLAPLRDLAPALVPPTHANPVSILLEICPSPETPPVRIAEQW
ncbi:2-amino-4-hydroxy-6-hydroxymethyldihydropteridine diphosphokinase [Roseibacillus ishigakijimensis]|uniref:2-amino-4-hydroxy-6-hydroxymethyldihydropteridine pyrophosphokinase n=1 Tax=Roseibacillus ishigakijimensis TaxID=454146 RepID=A0A934RND9_9BACT|nr:2-amino-4-hydroxy-6-hydroxymethyldihydropteridine diphosphokinase [Roseibacillus ishigakijimensis]MBK1834008.1 2-amino-4-hydroxy-6-hydroxymethyldihydropteridine diphosphokinase [Roseibacillus ishigakijimensis]